MGSQNKQETATILRVDGGMLEIAGNKGGMGITPINSKEIVMGGVTTTKFYKTETEGVIKAIHSPKGDEIYFSFTLPNDPVKNKEIDIIFDQILATFRFTDQAQVTPAETIERKFCGGTAANLPENQCPSGYKCQLDGNYPDSGGKCVKL